MKRFFLALGVACFSLLALMPADAPACPVRVVRVKKVVAVKEAVAVVETVNVVRFVDIPIYGVGYSVGQSPQTQEIESLKKEIAELRALLKQGQPLPVKDAGHVKVLSANCAGCHEAKVAKAKGGSFAMFDGTALKALSAEQKMKVLKLSKNGDMPKGGKPLSDEDFTKMLSLVD